MIGDAFVVVVVGGMGSITGAYLAAVLIAEIKALCIGIGVVHLGGFSVNFSKLTLVAEFLVMAVVLIVRPYGLLGRPQGAVRSTAEPRGAAPPGRAGALLAGVACSSCCWLLPLLARTSPYALVLGIDVLIASLFATSLHFIMGPGGMHSFGHAAYFGLGAYGAALLVKCARGADAARRWSLAPLVAGARRAAVRLVRGAACPASISRCSRSPLHRSSGRSCSSGRTHRRLQRRARHLADARRSTGRAVSFLLTLRLRRRSACCCCGACCSRRSAMRCAPAATRRCAPRRSASTSSACTGSASPSPARSAASPAALFAFAKGSISPETIAVGRSIDGLVMVLLGGIQTLTGPIVGASVFAVLQDTVMRQTEYLARAARRHHPAAGAGVSRAASSAPSASASRRGGRAP